MKAAAKNMPALRGRLAQVMLAMRPAPVSVLALEERFESYPASSIAALLRTDLAEYCHDDMGDAAYRLTSKGRALCPKRRELYATAEGVLAAQDDKKKLWESAGRRKTANQSARSH